MCVISLFSFSAVAEKRPLRQAQDKPNIVLIMVDDMGYFVRFGDRGKEQKDCFTKTNINIRDDWKLRSSGLLGPVKILVKEK